MVNESMLRTDACAEQEFSKGSRYDSAAQRRGKDEPLAAEFLNYNQIALH